MSLKSIAQSAWDKIPTPLRSVVNVGVGAALTAAVQYILNLKGIPTNLTLAEQGLGTAVSTAFFRAVNPLDTAYGKNSSSGDAYVPDLVTTASSAPADPAAAVTA